MQQLALRNFSQIPIKTYIHLFAHLEDIKNFSVCIFLTFYIHHYEVTRPKAAVAAEPGKKWCHPSSCNHHLENGVFKLEKPLCIGAAHRPLERPSLVCQGPCYPESAESCPWTRAVINSGFVIISLRRCFKSPIPQYTQRDCKQEGYRMTLAIFALNV